MGSAISWLDHSEEDQRRVREMLQLFSDKDTVDDLGIGTVRDAISNSLFPGTSVIQTRARYFLFVPWLFRQAEQRHPQQLVAKATDMERNLIEALAAGGDLTGPDRCRRREERPHPSVGHLLGRPDPLRHLPLSLVEHPPVRPSRRPRRRRGRLRRRDRGSHPILLATRIPEPPPDPSSTTWSSRQLADFATSYMTKGRLAYIEGRQQSRTWEAADGTKRRTVEVVADTFKALSQSSQQLHDHRCPGGSHPPGQSARSIVQPRLGDELLPFSPVRNDCFLEPRVR